MSQKKNILRLHVRALYGDQEWSLIYLTSQSYCEDKWFQVCFFSEGALTHRGIKIHVSQITCFTTVVVLQVPQRVLGDAIWHETA